MIKNKSGYATRSFKDHYLERKLITDRVIVATVLVFLMFILLLARLWYLQVVRFEDFKTRSNNNRISVIPIAPKRGLIYDRNGILLAENRSVYSLEVIPEQVEDLQQTLDFLLNKNLIEEKDTEAFQERLKGQRRFKSILLKAQMSEDEVARFAVDRHRLPGVKIEANLIRYYPYGEEIVHALGYVGRINERELNRIDQSNYKATRYIGKVGLEKFYEGLLHGKIGFKQVETDVQGRIIGSPLREQLPVPGKDLKLSLDIQLQLAASKALGAEKGSIVVLNPNNGEVLALVSNPAYDPNHFVTGISSKDYNLLTSSDDQPLFNRAIRGLYSPGSTIKPHLAWTGLENKLIDKNYTISDPGYWIIPNEEARVYRDWNKFGHGTQVNYRQAIIESCDPFFYDLAFRMGIDILSSYMFQFGFGQSTGIDMGEELSGIMPDRKWKREKRNSRWFPGETVITGIGQGYWVATPIQLANSVAQLATGDKRYDLRLVSHISSDFNGKSDNEKSKAQPPQTQSTDVLGYWTPTSVKEAKVQADFSNKTNLKMVHEAMYLVTQFPRGTAKNAFLDAAYRSAGKTGTVQLFTQSGEEYDAEKTAKHLRDNAVYVGYAPLDKPEIALAIVVENAGHGGSEAAPMARAIMDEYFLKIKNRKKQTQTAVSDKSVSDFSRSDQMVDKVGE
ncbi:MAG: penicillin-binding protein 2 [Gammaproteobacteria bacterium]|nr:penicillin-binding protein 2 [Gammaproteobacteria bacterium]